MFSILSIFCAIYFLIIGTIIFLRGKKNSASKVFFALCFTTFMWQFTWAILFQLKAYENYETGVLLAKVGYFFILFLPTTLYHFLTILSDKKNELKRVYFSYCLSGFLAMSLIFSNQFISGIYSYFWGYYPKAGILHPLHVLQTIVVVSRGLYIAYQKQRKTSSYIFKSQLNYCIVGLLIYLFASIDYLCNYGLEFYPIGIIFISISLSIISYSIVKHKLMDVNLIFGFAISRIIAYSALVIIVSTLYFFTSANSSLDNRFYFYSVLALMIVFCETYSFITHKSQILSDKILSSDRIIYQKAVKLLNQKLQLSTSVDEVFIFMEQFFSDILNVRLIGFYIKVDGEDENQNRYKIFNDDEKQVILNKNLIKSLIDDNSFIENTQIPDELRLEEKIVLTPFITHQKLVGFILIAPFKQKSFTYKHYEIFDLVIGQIGLVIDRLNAYNRISSQKEEFLKQRHNMLRALSGSISHEMRTPLVVAQHCAEAVRLVLEKAASNSTKNLLLEEDLKEIHEALDRINQAANSGHMIIKMILRQIYDKPMDKSNFALNSIESTVKNAVKQYVFSAEEQGKVQVDINSDADFIYNGDKDVFVFVLFNLLKNSLYYLKSHPQSSIKIFTSKTADFNYLHFKDSGPGIPKDKLPTIFESFMTSGKKEGTGLGLPFCKRIMESFGGNIACQSELGNGAEFIMGFPVIQNQEINLEKYVVVNQEVADNQSQITAVNEVQKTPEIPEINDKKTILLAEDESMIRKMMSLVLKSLNYNVLTAENGKEALEMLDNHKIDIVITDLQMPEIGGIEVAKTIREGKDFKNFTNHQDIIIIAFTANYDEQIIDQIMKSGMNGYIDKQARKDIVKDELKRLLGVSS